MYIEYEGKPDIRSMTSGELTEFLIDLGLPKFRAGQLYQWLHKHHVDSYAKMTNLPKEMIRKLEENAVLVSLSEVSCLVSEIDGTRKYLFALPDGNIIESVLMKYKHGNSVCVSTQVGCRMGCRFCASTLDGLVRNLNPSEILEEIYQIENESGEKVSNIVLMGSGEPMDNYENVSRFLTLISSEEGLNISKRNITLSTCGLVEGIHKLMPDHPQVTLALSLHAPDDETRQQIMPVARAYSLKDVIAACREYFEKTGRRVSFEYSLIMGVNDNETEARKLCKLLKDFPCHVNLIPVNPIKEREYKRSDRDGILRFKNVLEKNGINVTIRREMGQDIQGACGQLRRRFLEEQ